MTTAAEDAGIPELLWVERDPDRPGHRIAAVICPLCWKVHRHAVTRGPITAAAPWCDDTRVYEIDLSGEPW